MMNCCIVRRKAREENAHRSQSMEIDDVEETGIIREALDRALYLSAPTRT